jgi:hypothetical protein
MNLGLLKRAIPVAKILAVIVSLLPAATPVFASAAIRTWNTGAEFEAGVLTGVDTASSQGDAAPIGKKQ